MKNKERIEALEKRVKYLEEEIIKLRIETDIKINKQSLLLVSNYEKPKHYMEFSDENLKPITNLGPIFSGCLNSKL